MSEDLEKQGEKASMRLTGEIPRSPRSKCRCPEVGVYLLCLRKGKEIVRQAESNNGQVIEVVRDQIIQVTKRILAYALSGNGSH